MASSDTGIYPSRTPPLLLTFIRWITNQFNIYWGNGAHKYEPDFIVETADTIYMVETKKAKAVNDA
ncbi:MAG: hypothetical protein II041_02430, partial [Bacteroidales bacterium]|nr:hypothetical protein [Bacteroidales bacterium]